MSSRVFIIILINAIWALFPQNIIGCGPQPDPKDYYTSFFSNAHITDLSYKPFFYSALVKFYDDWDWNWGDEPAGHEGTDALITEWQQYAGGDIPAPQAATLIYDAPAAIVQFMVDKAEGKKTPVPADYDSFSSNSMAKSLLAGGKIEAMKYLVFAKQVQQLTYSADSWEAPVTKDSIQLMGLYKKAEILQQQVNDAFIQNKYAFMQCRLSFYAGNYPKCIQVADAFFGTSAPNSAVKPMSVGYKAGSFFRTGKKDEAAIWFARAFKMFPKDRKKNFLSFFWSTGNGEASLQASIIARGADSKEKALLAGLFALHGMDYGLENMKMVYSLDPQCELLPVLAVREIKKLEEQYLSPKLGAQKGAGEPLIYDEHKLSLLDLQHAEGVLAFFEQLAADKSLLQNDLYRMGAAYTAYITGKNDKALQWAGDVYQDSKTPNSKQQALLISLLSSVSKAAALNASTEASLLPMLQSLYRTAEGDVEYRIFLRNLFTQVLAPKYFGQGDENKTALCLGAANMVQMPQLKNEDEYYAQGYRIQGIDYVRNELSTIEAIKLHDFLKNNALSPYEKFLVEKSSFGVDEVADFIGTSYLRDHAWKQAIDWLDKAQKQEQLAEVVYNWKTDRYDTVFVNSFYDYLNDWQRYEKGLSKPMNKVELAEKMLTLERQFDTATNKMQKGKLAYSLGSAYYNLSYYGNSWMALDYYRSTYLWNNGKYTGWRKEYFEVRKARKYYQQAYELSAGNKEFQAAAYFLVARCAQRQIPMPDFDYDNWQASARAEKDFTKKFMNNPLFPQFKKEFGQTKYYKYVISRCSYLADFDKRK